MGAAVGVVGSALMGGGGMGGLLGGIGSQFLGGMVSGLLGLSLIHISEPTRPY